MTAAFRKGPGENIAEKNINTTDLKKSTKLVNFPHNHEGEKNKNLLLQDRMLSILILQEECQNDKEKSNLTRLTILTSLQTVNAS